MKKIFTAIILSGLSLTAFAQTQLPNSGFENWGNSAPGNADEPTGYYSNKTGSSTAQLGPQTCFKDVTLKHSGTASVRIESLTVPIINTVVNGNLTTGVVNAPTITKSDGYIGTVNYSNSSDVRRTSFTGRPDSLTGWYLYTPGGGNEIGKVKVILHTGDYFDPEAATAYHADAMPNRIGVAQFFTTADTVKVWKRFSVPFAYNSTGTPAYIMLNATSSADQTTSVPNSKLWLDDLALVYNSSNVPTIPQDQQVAVRCTNRTLYVDFLNQGAGTATVDVFDYTGRRITTATVTQHQLNTVALPDVPAGTYIYRINRAQYPVSGKFIVQ